MTLRHSTLALATAVLGLATLAAATRPPDPVGWTTIANDRRVLRQKLGQAAHAQTPDARLTERARALLREVPLIDGHNDLPWEMRKRVRYDLSRLDIRLAQPALQTDIARLRAGGLGAQFWSVYVPSNLSGPSAVTMTLEQIDFVHQLVRRYPDVFEWAGTADDVERIFRAGRIASMAGIEGGHSIDSSLATLRAMYRLGARYMTLTHNDNTPWADAANDPSHRGGLTRFGEAVVAEMNWLGMLVDLSHVSPDAMKHALRVTEAPVIFSHSSARAVCDVPRNVPDDVLRLLPANGGVVMVNFYTGFVSPACADWNRRARAQADVFRAQFPGDAAARQAALEQWERANPPSATLADVADHIDHIRRVAGVDHVGIGSDFDGIDGMAPEGLEDVSQYPALVVELLRRGYGDDDVKKVLGLNLLRVMRSAEAVAARLQAARPASVATLEQLDGRAGDPHHQARP